jgi:hypothetical protein
MEDAAGAAEPPVIGESEVIGDPIGELIGDDVPLEPVLDAGCVADEEWQPARASAMAAAPSGASRIVVRRVRMGRGPSLGHGPARTPEPAVRPAAVPGSLKESASRTVRIGVTWFTLIGPDPAVRR